MEEFFSKFWCRLQWGLLLSMQTDRKQS